VKKIVKTVLSLKAFFFLFRIKYDGKVIVLTEHLGDIIAALPASETLFELYEKQIYWIVNKSYASLLNKNPKIKVIEVNYLGEASVITLMSKLFRRDLTFYNMHFDGRQCSQTFWTNKNTNKSITSENYYNFGTLLEVFSKLSGAPIKYRKIQTNNSFLSTNFSKYIVIHAFSNESSRNCNLKFWADLVEYFDSMKFKVIEIGINRAISVEYEFYESKCGKRSLEEISKIIAGADLYIGVDSGFAHIANTFNLNSIILLGNYKNFNSYLPFDGYFRENAENVLFRYNQALNLLEFQTLKECTIFRQNKIFYD
jgi:heptosyltransferase III